MHETTNRSIEPDGECTAVERVDGQYRLVATKDFAIDDHILRLEGAIVDGPSRFSVQIGPRQHMEVPASVKIDPSSTRYRWRFLNHSCAPNATFDGLNLVATRPIAAAEQITFDYDTTEYDMASPFECRCGSDECRGVVRGDRWQRGEAGAAG